MLNIGCHLSCAKGYEAMGKEALSIEANCFQFFTRNPRGGTAKPIVPKDAQALIALMNEHQFAPILAHAPYTLNNCSADAGIRKFARETLADDLMRMEFTPHNMYNFHPGSHVGQGTEVGIEMIAHALNSAMFPEMTTMVLLETMAGKGSEVGRSFEELQQIIERTDLSNHIGVCLDTCHVHDGGYDIVNRLDDVLNEFDHVIGLNRLHAIHLNDSKNEREAHKDRHEKIGDGFIGLEALVRIINHPSLRALPFYLETPNELDGYQKEITMLRSQYIEK